MLIGPACGEGQMGLGIGGRNFLKLREFNE
jgi:hypothetical protein